MNGEAFLHFQLLFFLVLRFDISREGGRGEGSSSASVEVCFALFNKKKQNSTFFSSFNPPRQKGMFSLLFPV